MINDFATYVFVQCICLKRSTEFLWFLSNENSWCVVQKSTKNCLYPKKDRAADWFTLYSKQKNFSFGKSLRLAIYSNVRLCVLFLPKYSILKRMLLRFARLLICVNEVDELNENFYVWQWITTLKTSLKTNIRPHSKWYITGKPSGDLYIFYANVKALNYVKRAIFSFSYFMIT